MSVCKECRRPIAEQWRVCGWCGTEQAPRMPSIRSLASLVNYLLVVQSIVLTAATLGLAIAWAMRGWSVERGQTLGIIWLGVVLSLAFMAWMSITLSSSSSSRTSTETQAPQVS